MNDNFVKELRQWMKEVETRYDTTWNDKKYYTIEFYQKKWLDNELGNDTLVVLSYYSTKYDNPGYSGVFKLDKRNIAIFDKDSIGIVYYDLKTLKHVPLEYFGDGVLPKGNLIVKLFILKNGILERRIRLK